TRNVTGRSLGRRIRGGKRVTLSRSREMELKGRRGETNQVEVSGELPAKLPVMDGEPFLVDIRLNGTLFSKAFIDNGCLCYAAISEDLRYKLNLPRIAIPPRVLSGIAGATRQKIRWITYTDIDISGHRQRMYFYVIPNPSYPVILGL